MADHQADDFKNGAASIGDAPSSSRASRNRASGARSVSRRSFLSAAAKAGIAAAAAPLIVPRHVLGGVGYQAPSDTANIACVGVGGIGEANLRNLAGGGPGYQGDRGNLSAGAGSANVTALADVDHVYAADVFRQYPQAQRFYDYRRMFDEMEGEIDGVIVATPDHTHATITIEAMQRGMAVYTQKPLTWSVAEARALARVAEETGVPTQMGNQGHASDDARYINEIIRNGDIGTVEEVHVWTNRPIWPQGMDWPEVLKRKPEGLDWDVWLGPAPDVHYDPAFHPFAWRGWVDWGTGALGDMGAHLLDHPYWALELGYPEKIQTRSTPFNGISWPTASMTYYDFPARSVEGMGEQPPVKLVWYDGGLKPPRPEELEEGEELGNWNGGVMMVGSEGKLVHNAYGGSPRLLPTRRMNDYVDPPELFERVQDQNHEMNWVRAIKQEVEVTSDFRYAAQLTEVMLLGIVALRAGGGPLEYDGEAMRVTNMEEANQYLGRTDARMDWEAEEVTAMTPSSAG